ncbi:MULTISPECIES: hypothetical protein [Chelativorans]|jgi:hypothetical protein|uniref:hypothetical protein n=1 Tax=Chelativorans TaxID=449972 RepID=UPI00003A2D1F|nr:MULTISPECIES: hypothetical protein [Chelativorans]
MTLQTLPLAAGEGTAGDALYKRVYWRLTPLHGSGERKWHLALCAIASGIGYAVSAAFPHDLTIAVAGLSLATLGILAIFPVFWTAPSTFLSGVAAASGIALINSMGNLGSYLQPDLYRLGRRSDAQHPARDQRHRRHDGAGRGARPPVLAIGETVKP